MSDLNNGSQTEIHDFKTEQLNRMVLDEEWDRISMYKYLTEDFMDEHQDNLESGLVCCFQEMSESFIESHPNLINWTAILTQKCVNLEFVIKHQDLIDWEMLGNLHKISRKSIYKNTARIKPEYLVSYNKTYKEKPKFERILNVINLVLMGSTLGILLITAVYGLLTY